MRQVKTDLRGLNATEVLGRARTTLDAMKGNPLFPNPIPTMAEFEAACDALEESNIGTSNGGTRLDFVIKEERLVLVRDMMKSLAAYVSAVAKGHRDIVLSAAFDTRRSSAPITSLDAPQGLKARTGRMDGTIDVRWKPLRGARMYRLFINRSGKVNNDAWEELTLTTSSRYTASGLDALRYYGFRVEAIGTSAISPVSQAVTALSIGPMAA